MLTIRNKLILYFIVPLIGFTLVLFSASNYVIKREFLRYLEQEAFNDSERITNRITDAVFADDRFGLTDSIFNEKYANASIASVVIFNGQGAVIAHTSLETTPADNTVGKNGNSVSSAYLSQKNTLLFRIDRPIFSGLYKIGIVRIEFDFGNIINTFDYTLYAFVLFGLFSLIGITFFTFKLARYITKPIVALQEATEKFSEGDFSTRAPVRGHDEVADLTRSFNAMADILQASRTSLDRQKEALEEKVAELETWQHATVDRELAMIKLKEELASIKHKGETA